MKEWLGVDFDGTMSHYDGWHGPTHLGSPITKTVDKVKAVLAMGIEVRIFTARCYPVVEVVYEDSDMLGLLDKYASVDTIRSIQQIQKWSQEVYGVVLPITCVKDYGMSELWDDRAVQFEPNTGTSMCGSRRGYF